MSGRAVGNWSPVGGGRFVGRVGALAVALGVGSAIAAIPTAFADAPGISDSSGSAGASASEPARVSAAPNRGAARSGARAASARAAASATIKTVSATPLSSLGSRNTDDAPAAAPLAWTVAAVSRRELGTKTRTATPAATLSTGEPATFTPRAAQVSAPSAAATWQPGSVLRVFVGNGTAENPNAGILLGNGYTYTGYAGACTSGSCDGGTGGFIGNGGNGYNGGNGGAAGAFGSGGAGGDGITAVAGGTGGRGGLIVGDGGQGGAGAPFYAGGNGGSAVLWGAGGTGGRGGLVVYGVGLPGGTGGQGGLLYGATGATGETGATAPVVISDQYGSTTIGNKYVVMNNLWSGVGLQTINVSTTGFTITQETGSTPTNSGPLGYPAVYLGCAYSLCSPSSPLPMQISTITSATSSIDLTYPTDTSAVYDAAYDIWLNPTTDTTGQQQQEIMIWLNWQGGDQPVASTYDANGAAVPIATTTIDGMSWNVYGGTTEEGYENDVFSYLPVTPTPPITSLTNLNLLAFIDDTQSRTANYAQPVTDAWYLTSIQAGFEPHSGGIGLTVNSFDATVS
jgi:hypothetical protein